jgi:hypothetical protein
VLGSSFATACHSAQLCCLWSGRETSHLCLVHLMGNRSRPQKQAAQCCQKNSRACVHEHGLAASVVAMAAVSACGVARRHPICALCTLWAIAQGLRSRRSSVPAAQKQTASGSTIGCLHGSWRVWKRSSSSQQQKQHLALINQLHQQCFNLNPVYLQCVHCCVLHAALTHMLDSMCCCRLLYCQHLLQATRPPPALHIFLLEVQAPQKAPASSS